MVKHLPPPGQPFIIRCLSNYIKDTKKVGNSYHIFFKDANFDSLIIRSRGIPFSLDKKWEFVSQLKVINESEMSSRFDDFFLKLKGLEAELYWSGVFRRKPFFRTCTLLTSLRNSISIIVPDNRLINELNSQENLLKLIKSVKPSNMLILLRSWDDQSLIETKEHLLNATINFCKNPKSIEWQTHLSSILPEVYGIEKNIVKIYQIFNNISKIQKNITKTIMKGLKV